MTDKYSYILTAKHVGRNITPRLACSFEKCAEIYGVFWEDSEQDLAIYISDHTDQKPASISSLFWIGEPVSHLGATRGYPGFLSHGYIAGIDYSNKILLDSNCHRGSSGSGVINKDNYIVGVVVSIPLTNQLGIEGDGYLSQIPIRNICIVEPLDKIKINNLFVLDSENEDYRFTK